MDFKTKPIFASRQVDCLGIYNKVADHSCNLVAKSQTVNSSGCKTICMFSYLRKQILRGVCDPNRARIFEKVPLIAIVWYKRVQA